MGGSHLGPSKSFVVTVGGGPSPGTKSVLQWNTLFHETRSHLLNISSYPTLHGRDKTSPPSLQFFFPQKNAAKRTKREKQWRKRSLPRKFHQDLSL